MKRLALVATLAVVGCSDDGSGVTPDAVPPPPDAAEDPGSGSGSGAFWSGDPSPGDVTLEWMVLGLSAVLVAGSVRSRRRSPKPFEL